MGNLAESWWHRGQRDRFPSIEVIASDALNPDRIGVALDTILNDSELYDDPVQGRGSSLLDTEPRFAHALGDKLQQTVTQTGLVEAGLAALASGSWSDARRTAVSFLSLMAANGHLAS